MENLKIQYSEYLPEIDFGEFINGDYCHGISTTEFIEMAKGNIPEKYQPYVTKEEAWDYLAKFAIEFVGQYLKNWNGWTWQWYVSQFLLKLGLKPTLKNL